MLNAGYPLRSQDLFTPPLLKEAREDFSSVVEKAEFSNPEISIISNVSGVVVKNGKEAKKLCIEQVTSPVRWTREEETVLSLGADSCIETGPGKVLSGLWKKTGYDLPFFPAGTVDEIDRILAGN